MADGYDDGYDYHLRSHEDIMLTDQIPTGGDVYVAIPVDEVQPGVSPMEEDTLPPFQGIGPNETEVINETVDAQDPGASSPKEVPGPSNQTQVHNATVDFQDPGASNQSEVPCGLPRSWCNPGNIPPPFPEHVVTEPVESVDQIFSNEKEIHSPIVDSAEHSFEFQQHSEAPPSAISHEVPEMSFEEQLDQRYTGPSDIPELANSVEAEITHLFIAGSHASASGSQGVDSLSVRSRAVAQFLKRQSQDPPGCLGLKNILAEKARKLCARMFF
ncbi:hypothetical protein LWI28_014900 [Acer negundo]|uniref:Uncharacterized protein n=1 Tax=Acer negundo TaxID=4023 RepID=A0AAD5NPG9_ACENE|nr:hypothetical protein LWI28_014900 [Acer negundo]